MRVRLLFFALYRELAGCSELDFELPAGSTVSALLAALRARGGPLTRLPPSPVVAINREYARLDAILTDGDEVAILPPVAGG